jgi:hypothetical protein
MKPYVTTETLNARTAEWLAQVAPFNSHAMRLQRSASALLVVDMQKFFMDPASASYTCGGPVVLPRVQ